MDIDLLHLIDDFTRLKVLVIGEAMLDCYFRGTSDRLCQEAPVPVVNVTDFNYAPGGAANTAVNVCSLGGEVIFLSVIGNDIEGDRLQQAIQSYGVSTKYLINERSRQTLAKQRVYAGSQLIVRFDQGSTNLIESETEYALIEQIVKLFPACDAVIVSDYGYGIITPQIIKTLKELQAQMPRILVVDSKQLSKYRNVGITAVKPNYEQAVQLLGIKRQSASAQRVAQITLCKEQILEVTGAKIAAVTLDTEGAIIFERGSPPYRTYAQPVSHTQATGAGDTFVSALTLALAANAETPTAALLAAAATAVVVTKEGTTTCSAEALRRSLLGTRE